MVFKLRERGSVCALLNNRVVKFEWDGRETFDDMLLRPLPLAHWPSWKHEHDKVEGVFFPWACTPGAAKP